MMSSPDWDSASVPPIVLKRNPGFRASLPDLIRQSTRFKGSRLTFHFTQSKRRLPVRTLRPAQDLIAIL
jgi:hypothetical protein